MNTAARTIKQSIVTPKWLLKSFISKSQICFFTLLFAVVFSTLSVIYVTNQTRQLFSHVQQLQTQEQQLNTQWGQILLEQGAWQSPARVAEVATNQLDMVLPKNKHYILAGE